MVQRADLGGFPASRASLWWVGAACSLALAGLSAANGVIDILDPAEMRPVAEEGRFDALHQIGSASAAEGELLAAYDETEDESYQSYDDELEVASHGTDESALEGDPYDASDDVLEDDRYLGDGDALEGDPYEGSADALLEGGRTEDLVQPSYELVEPWHARVRHIVTELVMLGLGVVLLLLWRRGRDLRLGLAGSVLCMTGAAFLLASLAWVVVPGERGSAIAAWVLRPLLVLGPGLVVLTARRHRAMLLSVLAATEVVVLVVLGLLEHGDLGVLPSIAFTLCLAAVWLATATALVDHARTRPRDGDRASAGPYRTTPEMVGGDGDGAWLPRAVRHGGIAWVAIAGGLRVASLLGLVSEHCPATYALVVEVAMALAVTFCAHRARAADARRWFWIAAGLSWAFPIVRVGHRVRLAMSSPYGIPDDYATIDSELLQLLAVVCFASAVGAIFAGLRSAARAHRSTHARPSLNPVELAIVVLGAAPLPLLASFDPSWMPGLIAWPPLVALTTAGAGVLYRYLDRLSSWFEEREQEPGYPDLPAAERA